MFGCAQFTEPASPRRQMTAAEQNFEAVWRASRRVLRKHYFTLDREDRRAGIIVTRPMTGQYAGEFWRRDAATRRDLAEGTIQTLYRQVKVMIRPDPIYADRFYAMVEVQTYRSDQPNPRVTSTSEALDLFNLPGSRSRKKRLLDYTQNALPQSAVPLGRDENLEKRIAVEILVAAQSVQGKF